MDKEAVELQEKSIKLVVDAPAAFSAPSSGSQKFEWFELYETVCEDSRSICFRAIDTSNGEELMVRRYQPYLLQRVNSMPELMSALMKAANLKHDHIANVRSVETTVNGEVFGVQDYISGRTLEDLIKRKPASLETLRDIAMQMCDGLSYAHSQGVLHGSLSANDVVFAYDESGHAIVKIQNFGTGQLLSVASKVNDLTGHGALLEMELIRQFSAEQVLGKAIDERTDVYALGCLLYRLLYGFHHNAPPRERRPRDGQPPIPVAFNAVVMKMLESQPEKRYENLDKVKSALQMPTLLQEPYVDVKYFDDDPDTEPIVRGKKLGTRQESTKRKVASTGSANKRVWEVITEGRSLDAGGSMALFFVFMLLAFLIVRFASQEPVIVHHASTHKPGQTRGYNFDDYQKLFREADEDDSKGKK